MNLPQVYMLQTSALCSFLKLLGKLSPKQTDLTDRCTCVISHVQLCVAPCTVALQPLCPWDFSGKNTRVVCHFQHQGIFSVQGLNPCLLHWQVDSLPLVLQRN